MTTLNLKYGLNPHQKPAQVTIPPQLSVINGSPGYINLLDAIGSWQLVFELRQNTNQPAATSFKHVSPAGAAVYSKLSPALQQLHSVPDDISPLATAFVRARGADPLSSFGDFIALSDKVDAETAKLIRREVSDGIIAPDYSGEALDILKKKKSGQYVILAIDQDYRPPATEHRTTFGVELSQPSNFDRPVEFKKIASLRQDISPEARHDLLVAALVTKYSQSNSVACALNGQSIGIGAGQQSRLDCTRLATQKLRCWMLLQHPQSLDLPCLDGLSRTDSINLRIKYVRNELEPADLKLLKTTPQPLSDAEQHRWLSSFSGVALASDAFFPFRDNIDYAARHRIEYIIQPGGSSRDDQIISACDQHNMVLVLTEQRMFLH